MAADFIEWVQKQNFYHNTVIAVPGDHVVRGKNSIYPQRSKRQIFFTIINPQKGSEPQKHRRTTLDIAPTLPKPPVSGTMGWRRDKTCGSYTLLWKKNTIWLLTRKSINLPIFTKIFNKPRTGT